MCFAHAGSVVARKQKHQAASNKWCELLLLPGLYVQTVQTMFMNPVCNRGTKRMVRSGTVATLESTVARRCTCFAYFTSFFSSTNWVLSNRVARVLAKFHLNWYQLESFCGFSATIKSRSRFRPTSASAELLPILQFPKWLSSCWTSYRRGKYILLFPFLLSFPTWPPPFAASADQKVAESFPFLSG